MLHYPTTTGQVVNQLIFVDWDGTVVDSYQQNYLALNSSLESLNISIDVDIREASVLALDKLLLSKGLSIGEVGKVLQRKWDYYVTSSVIPEIMSKGLVEALRFLVNDGLKLAVLSNGSERRIRFDCARLDLQIFDEIFTPTKLGASKPDISAFKRSLKLSGPHFDSAVFIDDELENLRVASSVGFRCLGISRTIGSNNGTNGDNSIGWVSPEAPTTEWLEKLSQLNTRT